MPDSGSWSPGVFPGRYIEKLQAAGGIAAPPFDADQVQPASLDLRLGDVAYRVRSSFLPGPGQTVDERIKSLELHHLDLTDGAVLERGCVYLVPLLERLDSRTTTRPRRPCALSLLRFSYSPAFAVSAPLCGRRRLHTRHVHQQRHLRR